MKHFDYESLYLLQKINHVKRDTTFLSMRYWRKDPTQTICRWHTILLVPQNKEGPKWNKEGIFGEMSHHVQILIEASIVLLVPLSVGLHGHSLWYNADIFHAAEVSYWFTSKVSKTFKHLLNKTNLNKFCEQLLCTALTAHSSDPCTCR